MAAVLAAGPGAVLSHRAAANLWGISRRRSPLVDVTTPRAPRRIEGVAVHRTRRLKEADTTKRSGIPVTTVARTLVDLAEQAGPTELQRARHEAELLHSLTSQELSAAAIHGRRHGRRLKEPPDRTRSVLERAFRRLCERHHLMQPENNAKIAGLEVDFVWRDARLVVELDGWRYHGTRHAFETDRARDHVLKRAGYEVLRFTHRQVTDRPHDVAATLRAALASAA